MDLTLLDHISRGTAPITIHAGQHGAQITLSRPALLERGARVAQLLTNLGVEPGGRVVAFLPTGPAFLEVMLACWWSGLTFIPLPATSDRSTEVLRRRASAAVSVARPDAIVGTRASLAALEHPPDHIRLIPDDALFEAPATARAPVLPSPDQIAVMQFTSGSTGVPRGVQISHANMLANIGAIGRRTRMHRGDTISANGSSSVFYDSFEEQVLRGMLGEHASRVPVHSIKSMLGQTGAVTPVLQPIAACLSLQRGCLPPTTNRDDPLPAFGLDLVRDRARPASLRNILAHSIGFGGFYFAALAYGRVAAT